MTVKVLSIAEKTKFQLPAELLEEYRNITLARYQDRAETHRTNAEIFLIKEGNWKKNERDFSGFWAYSAHRTEVRRYERHQWLKPHYELNEFGRPTKITHMEVKKDAVTLSALETVQRAADNFQLKVEKWMKEGEFIMSHDLRLNGDLIEGKIFGSGPNGSFYIKARMIWNYRYGENSANGVLTQYVQFRGERH